MSLQKLSADVKAHIRGVLAKGQLDGHEQLGHEETIALKALLDDTNFWRNAEREPQLLQRYIGLLERSSWFHSYRVHEQYIFQN